MIYSALLAWWFGRIAAFGATGRQSSAIAPSTWACARLVRPVRGLACRTPVWCSYPSASCSWSSSHQPHDETASSDFSLSFRADVLCPVRWRIGGGDLIASPFAELLGPLACRTQSSSVGGPARSGAVVGRAGRALPVQERANWLLPPKSESTYWCSGTRPRSEVRFPHLALLGPLRAAARTTLATGERRRKALVCRSPAMWRTAGQAAAG